MTDAYISTSTWSYTEAMAHLYRGARVHQVFGADTDVGKTVFSTALALASAACPMSGGTRPASLVPHPDGEHVAYLKPVSTGPASDVDTRCV